MCLTAVDMFEYKAVCNLKGLSYLGLSPAVQWGAGHKELPRSTTSWPSVNLRMLVDVQVLSECTDLCIFVGGPRSPHPRTLLLISISIHIVPILAAIAFKTR